MIKKNHSLKNLEVVVLDCQATHSDPKKGVMFEIGWVKTQASEFFVPNRFEKKTESFLLKLPDGLKIPSSIKKITGLHNEDFHSAPPIGKIWPKLLDCVQNTAARNNMFVCPTIIHYANYETPYLNFNHNTSHPDITFPFHIICTHQIIKRLFPGLPRKGLRTVAGYFGRPLPETRRSLHHVFGTAFIWSQIVRLLEKQEGLSSFDDLLKWMDTSSSSASPSKTAREYPMAKDCRQDLPTCPGIYRMFRSNGDLLYIGKAKSLKHRVNSYFRQREKHSEHILEMLSQAKSLTFSVTKTALEAALKESDEIKVLAPPFNISLRLSNEGPVFSTSDLKQFRHKPDFLYRIGPLPSKRYIEPLSFIMDILNGKISSITPEIIQKTLSSPEDYSPDPLLFSEGLKEFKKQNYNLTKTPVTFPSVLKLGSHIWKEKLIKNAERRLQTKAEKDFLVLKPNPPKKKKKNTSLHWTPESLAKALSHIIRIGAYQIRRSRWLYLLTESSLIWESRERGMDWKNLVVFRDGRPSFEDPIPVSQETSLPTGQEKSFHEKQNNFDVFTYDRMRILCTEIRRILEEDRAVTLKLGPKLSLKSEQLREVLKWV